MTEIEKNEAIDRAVRFIDRNKGNKEHPKRIANEIIEGLKQVKLLGIANVRLSFLEEVRKKWGESDSVEFDEWLGDQLNEA